MSDGPVVGIVGDEDATVATAVSDAGGVPRPGQPASVVAESDLLVTAGEAALSAVARVNPGLPVLPVAAGRGVRAVPEDAVEDGVKSFLSGDYTTDEHHLLAVSLGEHSTARALQDVMLVSAEPAQISEYTVCADGERVARFRADGVVLATPAGSPGYAKAAGGPVVPPGLDGVVVVAVAPFSTDVDHWVLPQTTVDVSVERDETAVHLVADERVVGTVETDESVRISPSDTVEIAVVDASQSCFTRE